MEGVTGEKGESYGEGSVYRRITTVCLRSKQGGTNYQAACSRFPLCMKPECCDELLPTKNGKCRKEKAQQ